MDPDLVDATELLFQSYATHSSGKKPVVDGGGMKRLASDCNLFEESTGLTSEFYAGIIRRCSAAQSDGEGSEQVSLDLSAFQRSLEAVGHLIHGKNGFSKLVYANLIQNATIIKHGSSKRLVGHGENAAARQPGPLMPASPGKGRWKSGVDDPLLQVVLEGVDASLPPSHSGFFSPIHSPPRSLNATFSPQIANASSRLEPSAAFDDALSTSHASPPAPPASASTIPFHPSLSLATIGAPLRRHHHVPATPRGRTPDLDLLKEALSALFVDCIEVYVYLSCSGLSSMIKAWEMRRVLKGMRLQEVNVDRSVDEFLAGCRDKEAFSLKEFEKRLSWAVLPPDPSTVSDRYETAMLSRPQTMARVAGRLDERIRERKQAMDPTMAQACQAIERGWVYVVRAFSHHVRPPASPPLPRGALAQKLKTSPLHGTPSAMGKRGVCVGEVELREMLGRRGIMLTRPEVAMVYALAGKGVGETLSLVELRKTMRAAGYCERGVGEAEMVIGSQSAEDARRRREAGAGRVHERERLEGMMRGELEELADEGSRLELDLVARRREEKREGGGGEDFDQRTTDLQASYTAELWSRYTTVTERYRVLLEGVEDRAGKARPSLGQNAPGGGGEQPTSRRVSGGDGKGGRGRFESVPHNSATRAAQRGLRAVCGLDREAFGRLLAHLDRDGECFVTFDQMLKGLEMCSMTGGKGTEAERGKALQAAWVMMGQDPDGRVACEDVVGFVFGGDGGDRGGGGHSSRASLSPQKPPHRNTQQGGVASAGGREQEGTSSTRRRATSSAWSQPGDDDDDDDEGHDLQRRGGGLGQRPVPVRKRPSAFRRAALVTSSSEEDEDGEANETVDASHLAHMILRFSDRVATRGAYKSPPVSRSPHPSRSPPPSRSLPPSRSPPNGQQGRGGAWPGGKVGAESVGWEAVADEVLGKGRAGKEGAMGYRM